MQRDYYGAIQRQICSCIWAAEHSFWSLLPIYLPTYLPTYLCFNSHFPGEPALASFPSVSLPQLVQLVQLGLKKKKSHTFYTKSVNVQICTRQHVKRLQCHSSFYTTVNFSSSLLHTSLDVRWHCRHRPSTVSTLPAPCSSVEFRQWRHWGTAPDRPIQCYKCQYLQAYVSNYKPTANRCQHAPAVVFDPSVPVFWLFHAPEQTTVIVVLPSMDLVRGTVFPTNWDHLSSLWLRSETNWRRYYLTCNCCF